MKNMLLTATLFIVSSTCIVNAYLLNQSNYSSDYPSDYQYLSSFIETTQADMPSTIQDIEIDHLEYIDDELQIIHYVFNGSHKSSHCVIDGAKGYFKLQILSACLTSGLLYDMANELN